MTFFAIVNSDSIYERPIPERHRIVFYVGHLEAFDWNLFARSRTWIEKFPSGVRSALCIWHRSGPAAACRPTSLRSGHRFAAAKEYVRQTRFLPG